MTSTVSFVDAGQVLASLRAGVDELLDADPCVLGDDVLLDVVRELEVQRRRLMAVAARLVAEIEVRSIARDKGARNTTTLLSMMLRIDPGEAKARLVAAQDLAGRTTLSGERLEPIFPATAAALLAGEISAAHARVISTTIDALPLDVQATKDRDIEEQLL